MQLGPGLLGNIFDGIQRPLKAIAVRSGDVFIPRGVAVPALDETASWEFAPTTYKVGLRSGLSASVDHAVTTPQLGRLHSSCADAAAACCLSAELGLLFVLVILLLALVDELPPVVLCSLPCMMWVYCGAVCVQVGDRVTAGDIYGLVKENSLMDHKVRSWAVGVYAPGIEGSMVADTSFTTPGVAAHFPAAESGYCALSSSCACLPRL